MVRVWCCLEDLLCRCRDTWKELGLYLLLEVVKCVSLTPEECRGSTVCLLLITATSLGNTRSTSTILSMNQPHLVDLDRPSESLNSVVETTSTVFCAVWMYTVRMDRAWCCNTLTLRRFCRCTGPSDGSLYFLKQMHLSLHLHRDVHNLLHSPLLDSFRWSQLHHLGQ